MPTAERELRDAEAHGLLLLISLVWAGNFVAGKVALEAVGPITLTAIRAVLASAILLPYLRLTHRAWPATTTGDLGTFLVLALTGLVGTTTLWYYGLHLTLAVNAAIIGATGPIFVAMLSALWLRERLSTLNLVGVALSSAGVILTITRGSLRVLLELDLNAGDFVILSSQGVWAVYSVYARSVARRFAPTVVTTGSYVVSIVVLVPLALFERPWTAVPALTVPVGLAILYAALVVTVSHIWFYWANRVVPAAIVALTVNLIPFEVLAFSWWVLDEPITWVHAAGALVVILGVGLARRKPGTRVLPPARERVGGP